MKRIELLMRHLNKQRENLKATKYELKQKIIFARSKDTEHLHTYKTV